MKSELRKKYAAERNGINDKANKDEAISAAFLCSDFYINADEILCYYPIKSEISTLKIIKAARADGKTLLLPVCSAESGIMRFYQCSSVDDLKIGKYGIPEPDTDKCKTVDTFKNAVCIVPAYAFDKRGFRLGYGGGYYDRFLAKFNSLKIGLCYSEMLADNLPSDEYDIKVDYILTENGFIKAIEED